MFSLPLKSLTRLCTLLGIFALGHLAPSSVQAAVTISYLGIQHGSDDYAWAFHYDSTDLAAPQTGLDLLEALFGSAVSNGTYTDGFGGTNPYLTLGDSQNGAGFISYDFGLFLESLTLNGTKIAMDPFFNQTWNYFVAGGENGAGIGGTSPPPDFMWTEAQLGFSDRLITGGSFDAWAFGAYGTTPNSFQPSPTDPVFANAEIVMTGSLVPEPGRAALITMASLSVLVRRRRCRKVRRKPDRRL